VETQFSLPFGVAVALVHGDAGPDRFQLAACDDPAVARLLPRVVAVRDPALDARFPREWPCWVRVHMRGSAPRTQEVVHPKGDAERFLSAAELDVKFSTLAARTLPGDGVSALRTALAAFPDASSARALLAAAVPTVT
jgi:2-methylcitrate dehydratase PrpD